MAFLALRLSLMLGRFNYAERRGILDIRHKGLFTRASLVYMLADEIVRQASG